MHLCSVVFKVRKLLQLLILFHLSFIHIDWRTPTVELTPASFNS